MTRLADVLTRHGIKIWYSETNLRGAQLWHDEIGDALQRCDWFIVVLTLNAVNSIWVKRELLFALQEQRLHRKIVPILYQSCNHIQLSWSLGSVQMVDYRANFDQGCSELLKVWDVDYIETES